MTYVVGTIRGGVGIIVADTRLTRGNDGHDGAVKCSFFFPGCLYGASGDAGEIRRFIQFCKFGLHGTRTLAEWWQHFGEQVRKFDFNANHKFELLLLSRASGRVRLYRFSSDYPVPVECRETTAIGAGTAYLNELLKEFERHQFPPLWRLFRAGCHPVESYGFAYCLWLTQLTKGDEYHTLQERYKVGGVFHFVYQRPDCEAAQPPSAYLLCHRNEGGGISVSIYRVAYFEGAVVVYTSDDRRLAVSLEVAARPEFAEWSDSERSDFLKRTEAETLRQPYYAVCGIGVARANARHGMTFHTAHSAAECLLSWDGPLHPDLATFIQDTVAPTDASPSQNAPWIPQGINREGSLVVPDRIAEWPGQPGWCIELVTIVPQVAGLQDVLIATAMVPGVDAQERLDLYADRTGEVSARWTGGGLTAAVSRLVEPGTIVKVTAVVAAKEDQILLGIRAEGFEETTNFSSAKVARIVANPFEKPHLHTTPSIVFGVLGSRVPTREEREQIERILRITRASAECQRLIAPLAGAVVQLK